MMRLLINLVVSWDRRLLLIAALILDDFPSCRRMGAIALASTETGCCVAPVYVTRRTRRLRV